MSSHLALPLRHEPLGELAEELLVALVREPRPAVLEALVEHKAFPPE